jgi:hypothetical protein
MKVTTGTKWRIIPEISLKTVEKYFRMVPEIIPLTPSPGEYTFHPRSPSENQCTDDNHALQNAPFAKIPIN